MAYLGLPTMLSSMKKNSFVSNRFISSRTSGMGLVLKSAPKKAVTAQ